MAEVVITARNYSDLSPDAVEKVRSAGHRVTVIPDGMVLSEDELADALKDAEGVIVSLEKFTRSLLTRLPKLKVISRRGVGVDSIDMDACSELGIRVERTFGQVEGSVAEYAVACLFYFARRLHVQNASMQEGEWKRMLTGGVKTRTLGLVGFGGIGTEIARRAAALDMKLLYHARHRKPEPEAQYGAEYVPDLYELLSRSDYVVAAVPLTAETRVMFDRRAFEAFKDGSVFINVARAPIVCEDALEEALRSGKLSGMATDVYEKEPCTDSRFRGMDNVLLTPHTAPYTTENFACMNHAAADNLIRFFREER